jgi:hypothetical protein
MVSAVPESAPTVMPCHESALPGMTDVNEFVVTLAE